jgi:hypothetical protein
MNKLPFALALLFLYNFLSAQEKTFVREYTYKASEMDSRNSCRKIAINELQLTLLHEIGVYVESEQLLKTSEVDKKFTQDFVENIATVSAGVTKLNVLDETWNGEVFWMKASVTIDPKSIEQSLKQLIGDRQKVKEMEELKRQLTESRKIINELNEQLKSAKNQKEKSIVEKKFKKEIETMPNDFLNLFFVEKVKIVPTYSIFRYNGDSVICRRTSNDQLLKLKTVQPIGDGLNEIEQKYGYFWLCVTGVEDILDKKKSGEKGWELSFKQSIEALSYYSNKYKMDLNLSEYINEFNFYQTRAMRE